MSEEPKATRREVLGLLGTTMAAGCSAARRDNVPTHTSTRTPTKTTATEEARRQGELRWVLNGIDKQGDFLGRNGWVDTARQLNEDAEDEDFRDEFRDAREEFEDSRFTLNQAVYRTAREGGTTGNPFRINDDLYLAITTQGTDWIRDPVFDADFDFTTPDSMTTAENSGLKGLNAILRDNDLPTSNPVRQKVKSAYDELGNIQPLVREVDQPGSEITYRLWGAEDGLEDAIEDLDDIIQDVSGEYDEIISDIQSMENEVVSFRNRVDKPSVRAKRYDPGTDVSARERDMLKAGEGPYDGFGINQTLDYLRDIKTDVQAEKGKYAVLLEVFKEIEDELDDAQSEYDRPSRFEDDNGRDRDRDDDDDDRDRDYDNDDDRDDDDRRREYIDRVIPISRTLDESMDVYDSLSRSAQRDLTDEYRDLVEDFLDEDVDDRDDLFDRNPENPGRTVGIMLYLEEKEGSDDFRDPSVHFNLNYSLGERKGFTTDPIPNKYLAGEADRKYGKEDPPEDSDRDWIDIDDDTAEQLLEAK